MASASPLDPVLPESVAMPSVIDHGILGAVYAQAEGWQAPARIYENAELARPGYVSKESHEYSDTDATLALKIKLLADLIRRSKSFVAYTGAGISTSSGIDDYASASDSSVIAERTKLRSPFDAQPTRAHFVLTALERVGLLKTWVQQNHDGLPQKAGFPQCRLNEIHGAWYDPSNPVVMMSGELRGDLFAWMEDTARQADLVLAMGTSLAGMNADQTVTDVTGRYARAREGRSLRAAAQSKRQACKDPLGAVIVNLQRTQLDDQCTLRIYAKINHVMELLAAELGLEVPSVPYALALEAPHMVEPDVYRIQFDEHGALTPGRHTLLDLREGSHVRLTSGQFKGDMGEVCERGPTGHYRIRFFHALPQMSRGSRHAAPRDAKVARAKQPMLRVFGSWWIELGCKGQLPAPGGTFPVVNCSQSLFERSRRGDRDA